MTSVHLHSAAPSLRARVRPVAWLAGIAIAAVLVAGAPEAHAAGGQAAAVAGAAATAADPVKLLRAGTRHDGLYDIAFEGEKGIAVGALGSVVVTADGGKTWEPQAFPMSNLALLSVAMHGGKCIAVGQVGMIYTADDCKTWKLSPSATKSRLLSVGVNKQGLAYAVGAFGTILKSPDFGKTWEVVKVDWTDITPEGAEPHLYDVHVGEDGVITAVGEFELVLRSTDGGKQWKTLHKGERSLFGLAVLEGGKIYAVGQSGALISSSDNGATWQSIKTGSGAILTGLYATPKGEIVASGINALVVSKDGGATWNAVSSKLIRNAWHQALAVSEGGNGKRRLMSVGAGGSILELDL